MSTRNIANYIGSGNANMLANDAIRPEQYHGRTIETGRECWRELWLRLLAGAIEDLHLAFSKDVEKRHYAELARVWMYETDRDYPNGLLFEDVCMALGYDADCIREGCRRYANAVLRRRGRGVAKIVSLAVRRAEVADAAS